MKLDDQTTEEIREVANSRIEYVLSELGIDDNLKWKSHYCNGVCPIHENADNDTAFSYSTKYRTWKCFTAACEHGDKTIFGLIKKVLSKQQGREISRQQAILWLAEKLEIDVKNRVELDPKQKQLHDLLIESKVKQHIHENSIYHEKGSFNPIPINGLKIEPSWYFLEKGFSKETLNKYKVGYCDDPYKIMYLRSYAPILNEKGDTMIGVTGRTRYEKCEFCSSYHEQGMGCPHENNQVRGHVKWLHFGFSSGNTLYNLWNSLDIIKRTKTVLLTEGTKDVWWLDQNGIKNTCCIFGLNISPFHINKLAQIGATKVILALNNDERGIEAMERIIPTISMYFKVITINHLLNGYKDFAEIPSDYINDKIKPFVDSIGGVHV